MKITGNETEKAILKEMGNRLKQHRLSANMTQVELADNCNLSISTIVRLEQGKDQKFSNYISALKKLNLLQNIDLLVPEVPDDFEAIYEKRKVKQRVKNNKSKITKQTKAKWVWGDEKKGGNK